MPWGLGQRHRPAWRMALGGSQPKLGNDVAVFLWMTDTCDWNTEIKHKKKK